MTTKLTGQLGALLTLVAAVLASGFLAPVLVFWLALSLLLIVGAWIASDWGLRVRSPVFRRAQRGPQSAPEEEEGSPASWRELNDARTQRYQENRGVFLVHSWRPSGKPGQVADVKVRLHQHGPGGPLSQSFVEAVEYTLGPRFSEHSIVKKTAEDNFEIEVSLWGSMLCLAKVYFTDGSPPLLLERYINLDSGTRPPLLDEERRRRLKMLPIRRAQEGDALGDAPDKKRMAWSNAVYDLLSDAFGSERFGLPGTWGGGTTYLEVYSLRRLIAELEQYELRPEFDPRDWE